MWLVGVEGLTGEREKRGRIIVRTATGLSTDKINLKGEKTGRKIEGKDTASAKLARNSPPPAIRTT